MTSSAAFCPPFWRYWDISSRTISLDVMSRSVRVEELDWILSVSGRINAIQPRSSPLFPIAQTTGGRGLIKVRMSLDLVRKRPRAVPFAVHSQQ
jgi:hypothetical protein